jgi:D-glycero-D-manno-heptose 1,7-bisphosphate phosphatase
MLTATRVVLLDRDGVINVDRSASVLSAAQFALIPGSLAALVAVVTNQVCIGRGQVSTEVVEQMHAEPSAVVAAGGQPRSRR